MCSYCDRDDGHTRDKCHERLEDKFGSSVDLRDGETGDDDSHADVVAAQLAEADEETLEEIGEGKEVRTDGGLERFGVDPDEPETTDRADDAEISEQCRALTTDDDRCTNAVTHMSDGPLCGPHSNAEDVEMIDEHTHYCEDCETKLALLYDDRDDESNPIVCGHCGGTNTRPLEEREILTDGGFAPPSELERDDKEAVYGTLNPSLALMNSDELKDELERIIEDSTADGGRIVGTTGQDYVEVELLFSPHNAGMELGVFDDEDDGPIGTTCSDCGADVVVCEDGTVIEPRDMDDLPSGAVDPINLAFKPHECDDREIRCDGGTRTQSDRLAGWNPNAAAETAPRCRNCGTQHTKQFARVFGDNRDVIHACPDCETYREMQTAAVPEEGEDR